MTALGCSASFVPWSTEWAEDHTAELQCTHCSVSPPCKGPQYHGRLRFSFLGKCFQSKGNISRAQNCPKNCPPALAHVQPLQARTHGAFRATSTLPVFIAKGLMQSHAEEELPGRWMPLQILPSTWNASDCLLNCSSKRKHWQASIIKMEAKGNAVTFNMALSSINPRPRPLERPVGTSGPEPHQLPSSQPREG